MKKFIIICVYFLFTINPLSSQTSQNLICKFEEVYANGQIQNGLMLIMNDKLRYQYHDNKLFTLLFLNNKLFFVENKNIEKYQLIDNSQSIVPDLFEIYKKFPNISKSYNKNGYEINIEKNADKTFAKRIYIKSNRLNLSIHFFDCHPKNIDLKYFNFKPFVKYDFN